MAETHPGPPDNRPNTVARHRVPFYQTDAMGIVHHANYVHLLEVARIQLLDEVDVPYADYLAQGLHYAVTKVDVRFKRAARYDDVIETTVWVQWVRGASLGIGYELRVADEVIATAATEHAMVDNDGRPTRIPRERRANLTKLVASK